MSIKGTVRQQYQEVADSAAASVARDLHVPKEGWLATMRKALGMSGAQLGRRLTLSRGRISQAEKAEQSGGVSLKTMREMAEAMGCRFVYAIVPENGRVVDLIEAQARKKATALVRQASTHMALEKQSLSDAKNRQEVDRVTLELMRAMPGNLWADE
jgi:predicted DNA-binding mobile mystery protein A